MVPWVLFRDPWIRCRDGCSWPTEPVLKASLDLPVQGLPSLAWDSWAGSHMEQRGPMAKIG